MKKFNNNYRATVKNTLLEMMYMSGTLCEGPGDRREHDLLTQDEAENGNPRENRIKTQRRYEALPPEEKKARGERANDKRKELNAKLKELSDREEESIMAGLPDEAARDARKKERAEKAKTGAWRIDPATGEKLKNAKGEVMDPKEYAARDKANGIKTPSEFGDGRTLGQRLAGVGKHQRVYEPMTKADQQKRYDNSSKDINNPGYDNSEYGKQQRHKEWEVIDNEKIYHRNFGIELKSYSAEVKRNRESGSNEKIDMSNYPTLSRSNAKKEADKKSADIKAQVDQEVAAYNASPKGKEEAEMYKRENAAITAAGSLAAREAQVAARLTREASTRISRKLRTKRN